MNYQAFSADAQRNSIKANPDAADDLLFALKNMLDVLNGRGGTAYPAYKIAYAAIAKAEGRLHDPVEIVYVPGLVQRAGQQDCE